MHVFDETQPGGPMTKYIEPKVSLMWLLSGFMSIMGLLGVGVWNVAAANAQMDRIAESVARLENQIDARDGRIDRLALEIQTNKSMNEVQNARIQNIEEQLKATRAFVGVKP